MKDTKLLLVYFFTTCLLLSACGKRDTGYFSDSLNTPSPPSSAAPTDSNEIVYSFGIIIRRNSTYTFNLPNLTQLIIDSGTVDITFKSDIITSVWEPLPIYIFPNGDTIMVELVSEQPGQIVLAADGRTTPAMDYCFSFSFPK
jgi:hypothetical protein